MCNISYSKLLIAVIFLLLFNFNECSRRGGVRRKGGRSITPRPRPLHTTGHPFPPSRSTYHPHRTSQSTPTYHRSSTEHHPVGPPVTNKPLGTSNYRATELPGQKPPPGAPHFIRPAPYNPQLADHGRTNYSPANNPVGYGPPPPYNPYHGTYGPQTYPQQHYPQGNNYPHGYPSQGGINIINHNVNHNYGGGNPGYTYSSHDTGSGALGFFLGYSLGKLTAPPIHYINYHDGYTPRYDHYTVHHYYHNRNSIPQESTIQQNAIIACIGDSASICPRNTTSLCTSNGAVLCVAAATTTVPCSNNISQNCVKSEIPCVGNTTCQQNQTKSEIIIPCISTAKVYGNITYYNNTIVISSSNISEIGSLVNSTAAGNNSHPLRVQTVANFTVTPLAVTPKTGDRKKREVEKGPLNTFCVTILALPAQRELTEGEKVVNTGGRLFTKFLLRAMSKQT